MKWFVFLLVGLNLLLGIKQWTDLRSQLERPAYKIPSNINKLKLLHETDSVTIVNSEGVTSDPGCWLAGPFQTVQQAELARKALSIEHYRTGLIDQELDKAPGYWVHYGPFASQEDRLNQLDEFQKKSIESFVIRSGELQGHISLGVFRNIDSARRMLKGISDKGFEASMTEIEKTDHEYWIAISPLKSDINKAQLFSEFKGLDSPPEMRQIFCKTVASDMEFL